MKKGSLTATIITLLIGIPIVVWSASLNKMPLQTRTVEVEVKVPMSIRELQTFLKDTGKKRYDIGPKGVDGDLGGPDSCTRKAWSNYICDRQAIKEFE